MNRPPDGDGATDLSVPRRGAAVVSVWSRDRDLLEQTTITAHQRLILGRAPDYYVERRRLLDPGYSAERDGLVYLTLTQSGSPLISRAHLAVEFGPDGWRLRLLRAVRNRGRRRYWGDMAWDDADPANYLRHGLIAFLFPGEPQHLVTVTAPGPPMRPPTASAAAAGVTTDPGQAVLPVHIEVNPTQLTVLATLFADALQWPPTVADGRVPGWQELSVGGSARKTYERLAEKAANTPGLGWADNGKGADPRLLRRLINVGAITYAGVYALLGDWPTGGLMPTHDTHTPEGRRRLS